MGGPGGGYRTMTEEEMHELFGNEDPFSDFFRTFFGGGAPGEGAGRARQGRAPRTQKGRDIEHEVELTLEEAYHGTTRRISIKQGGHARSVDVRIPVGVKDGSRVRAAGEGESGANGGASGDLYLRVRIRPHPVFERKGIDLHTTSRCRSRRRSSVAKPRFRRLPARCGSRFPRRRRAARCFG